MLSDNCFVVVMAGGAGTRLWPLSRKNKPKHFLKLFNDKSLIELTVDKLANHVPNDRILVLTSVNYRELSKHTLPQIPPDNFIFEPCIRDTASAIGLAATVLKQRCEEATMIVLTADQIIEPVDRFNTAIANAVTFLDRYPQMLVCFAIEAASANPLVGWQKLGEPLDFCGCEVRRIVEFIEKPPADRAQRFLDEGGFCWNSGQFAWKARTILQELSTHLPEATPILENIAEKWNTDSRDQVLADQFPKMPSGSIDYRILQKTDNACSLLLPCSWEDMGTHTALAERIGSKSQANTIFGKAIVTGSGNKVLNNTGQSVVVALDNSIVVVTEDTIFVGDRNTDLKTVVADIAQQSPEIL
jgi:mannose-1-phosphate guanylyltransferase